MRIDRRFGPVAPFAVLKAVRDRELTHIPPVSNYSEPYPISEQRELLRRLANEGVLHTDESGALSVDPLVLGLFRALSVRLTDLESFTEESVVCNPHFRDSRRTGEYPTVFVLMPFKDELRPVYDDHIKPVVRNANLTVVRADDLSGAETVVNEIWSFIKHAAVVIADCTGRNPNVFYEIGIAHTVGVPVILIAQDIGDVPFDLRHQRIIEYRYTPPGMKEFEEDLLQALRFEGLVRSE